MTRARRSLVPRLLAWAAVALAVALVAVALTRDHEPAPDPTPTVPPPPEASVVPVAPPQAPASQPPRILFTGLRWEGFHGLELPVSAVDGPLRQDGDLASGFSQTPRGALLAALHIGVRANSQWGPKVFGPTIGRQVVGSDQKALLEGCRRSYAERLPQAGVSAGDPLGDVHVVQAGFRWQSYTPSTAVVDLLTAGAGAEPAITVRVATRVQVLWQGGDWRLVAPPGGNWGASATPVPSAAGFTLYPRRG